MATTHLTEDEDLLKNSRKMMVASLLRKMEKSNPSLGGNVLNGLAMGLMGMYEKMDRDESFSSTRDFINSSLGGPGSTTTPPIDPLKLTQEKTDDRPPEALPPPTTPPALPTGTTAPAVASAASPQQAALAQQLVRPMMGQKEADQQYGAVGVPPAMPSGPTDMMAPSLNAGVAFGQQGLPPAGPEQRPMMGPEEASQFYAATGAPGAPSGEPGTPQEMLAGARTRAAGMPVPGFQRFPSSPDYGNPAVANPMDMTAQSAQPTPLAGPSPEWQRLQEYQRSIGKEPQAPPDPSMMRPRLDPSQGPQSAVAPPQATRYASNDPLTEFAKRQEGFSPNAKWDHKQYSIGYGTKGSPGQTMTREQAEGPLQADLANARKSVEQFAPDAPPGVKDALTSLTMNAGPGWQQAGLGRAVLQGDYEGAKQRFLQYVNASGQKLPGLENRRNAEVSQFWDGRGQQPGSPGQPPPYQVAQAGGQTPGPPGAANAQRDPWIPYLQGIMNDPNKPRKEREQAMRILGQKLLQEPKMEYKTLDNRLLQTDPTGRTAPRDVTPQANRYRPLTDPTDRARFGIPPEDKRPYQLDVSDNKLVNPPPETRVNIDQRGEDTFRKEAGKIRAEEYGKIVTAGNNARQSVSDVQNLGAILTNIKTGKMAEAKASIGPYADALGIKVEGLSEIQAANAIIARIAPSLRTPGVGAQSDYELKNFLQSIPSIGNTTDGNAIIQKTLGQMYENKTKAGEIAAQALDGDITRKEADKLIRELPDALNDWREHMKKNPTGAGGTTKGGIEWKLQ